MNYSKNGNTRNNYRPWICVPTEYKNITSIYLYKILTYFLFWGLIVFTLRYLGTLNTEMAMCRLDFLQIPREIHSRTIYLSVICLYWTASLVLLRGIFACRFYSRVADLLSPSGTNTLIKMNLIYPDISSPMLRYHNECARYFHCCVPQPSKNKQEWQCRL